jgi:hypothetical protein
MTTPSKKSYRPFKLKSMALRMNGQTIRGQARIRPGNLLGHIPQDSKGHNIESGHYFQNRIYTEIAHDLFALPPELLSSQRPVPVNFRRPEQPFFHCTRSP